MHILAAIDFAALLPVTLFVTFAAGAWFLLDLMSSKQPRAEERLAELNQGKRNPANANRSASDKFAEALEKQHRLCQNRFNPRRLQKKIS